MKKLIILFSLIILIIIPQVLALTTISYWVSVETSVLPIGSVHPSSTTQPSVVGFYVKIPSLPNNYSLNEIIIVVAEQGELAGGNFFYMGIWNIDQITYTPTTLFPLNYSDIHDANIGGKQSMTFTFSGEFMLEVDVWYFFGILPYNGTSWSATNRIAMYKQNGGNALTWARTYTSVGWNNYDMDFTYYINGEIWVIPTPSPTSIEGGISEDIAINYGVLAIIGTILFMGLGYVLFEKSDRRKK